MNGEKKPRRRLNSILDVRHESKRLILQESLWTDAIQIMVKLVAFMHRLQYEIDFFGNEKEILQFQI